MEGTKLKVVLLGDGEVGKTTWLKRLIDERFETKYIATLGVEVENYITVTNSGEVINLEFWDTAGQEKFGGYRNGYYYDSDAAIIFYDLTSLTSAENVSRWQRDFIAACPDKPILSVGTKTDQPDQRVNLDTLTISSRTGDNIMQVIPELLTLMGY